MLLYKGYLSLVIPNRDTIEQLHRVILKPQSAGHEVLGLFLLNCGQYCVVVLRVDYLVYHFVLIHLVEIDDGLCLQEIYVGTSRVLIHPVDALALVLQITALNLDVDVLKVPLVESTSNLHLSGDWAQELGPVQERVLECPQI